MSYTPLVFDAAPAQLVPAKDSALARIRAQIYSGEFQPGSSSPLTAWPRGLGSAALRSGTPSGSWSARGWSPLPRALACSSAALPVQGGGHLPDEGSEPSMARWAAERPSAVQRAGHRDAVT